MLDPHLCFRKLTCCTIFNFQDETVKKKAGRNTSHFSTAFWYEAIPVAWHPSRESRCSGHMWRLLSRRLGAVDSLSYLSCFILVCACVLSALAPLVMPRMDAEEAACVWLLNLRFPKQRGRHYWLNLRGASAQTSLIGWHTANGAVRYPAVALESQRLQRGFPAAGKSQKLCMNSSIA